MGALNAIKAGSVFLDGSQIQAEARTGGAGGKGGGGGKGPRQGKGGGGEQHWRGPTEPEMSSRDMRGSFAGRDDRRTGRDEASSRDLYGGGKREESSRDI